MPHSIAIISNNGQTLLRFRGPLIRTMSKCGLQVYALAADLTPEQQSSIRELGAEPISISMERTGTNPIREIRDLAQLRRILRQLPVDTTFAFFTKSVIYGSLAASLAGVPYRYSLITGLGYLFSKNTSQPFLRQQVLHRVLCWLYRIALQNNQMVFFQNPDDLELFVDRGWVKQDQAIHVNGTGIDLSTYAYKDPITQPVTFLLAARPIIEKGIREFAEAARQVKTDYPNTRFILLGGSDSNPNTLNAEEIRTWVTQGILEWPGQVDDVRPWLAEASVFVLPSYYREGIPRSIQEAMAMGRPIITTDLPGCRETTIDGQNGYLIPARSPDILAQTMMKFLVEPSQIVSMGQESRRLAEQKFDVHHINSQLLANMGIEPYQSRSGALMVE